LGDTPKDKCTAQKPDKTQQQQGPRGGRARGSNGEKGERKEEEEEEPWRECEWKCCGAKVRHALPFPSTSAIPLWADSVMVI
jgi:hypothetical protein